MATKNKGGRPPRAPGEKMTRLSVMLRPIYREALDLLAREQRTSISQALESLLSQATRQMVVDDKNLFQLAMVMSQFDNDTYAGQMLRYITQPFKTPEEQYICDAWEAARNLKNLGPIANVDEELLRLFTHMAEETYKMGSPPAVCAEMFINAVIDIKDGKVDRKFYFTDAIGVQYIYDLNNYINDDDAEK